MTTIRKLYLIKKKQQERIKGKKGGSVFRRITLGNTAPKKDLLRCSQKYSRQKHFPLSSLTLSIYLYLRSKAGWLPALTGGSTGGGRCHPASWHRQLCRVTTKFCCYTPKRGSNVCVCVYVCWVLYYNRVRPQDAAAVPFMSAVVWGLFSFICQQLLYDFRVQSSTTNPTLSAHMTQRSSVEKK